MYLYVCIYIKYLSFLSLAKGHGFLQPQGKSASLLIVFATSVSESSLLHFSFQEAERRSIASSVCAVPVAAKWGSWDNSLVFLKPHFGALSAVLAPLLFCLAMALSCAYICVTVTFAWLLCLACSIWGQDARTRAFSVCLRLLYQLQVTPLFTRYVLFFFPCLLLGEGGVLIRVEMSCVWLMAFSSPAWPSQSRTNGMLFHWISKHLSRQYIPCRSRNRLNKVRTCLRVHSC